MILIGTTTNQCVVSHTGSFPELVSLGRALAYWAIFWDHLSHGPFHNATDDRYLVAHWRDPFWLNCGFEEQYDYSKAPTRSIHEAASETYQAKSWYYGPWVAVDRYIVLFEADEIPTRESHGEIVKIGFGPFETRRQAVMSAHYQYERIIQFLNEEGYGFNFNDETHEIHEAVPVYIARSCGGLNAGYHDYLLDLEGNKVVFEDEDAAVNFLYDAGIEDHDGYIFEPVTNQVKESASDIYQPLLIDAADHTPTGRKAQRRSVDRTMAKIRKLHEDLNAALYSHPTDRPTINNPQDAVQILAYFLTGLEQEEFWVLNLDTKNRISHCVKLYVGTVNQSNVRVSEVFRQAIIDNNPSIIIGHNHPSGDPSPSPEDISVTRAIVQAGGLLDIDVLDHLVIGEPGRFVSMKERQLGFN